MKTIVIIALLMLLAACGQGPVLIEIETVPTRRALQAKCREINPAMPADKKCNGLADWTTVPQGSYRQCTIYMLPRDLYCTPENRRPPHTYESTLGHETRHCFEGDFHPKAATTPPDMGCGE